MKKIEVTESLSEELSIAYVSSQIKEIVNDFGGETSITRTAGRLKLTVTCLEKYYDLYKAEIEDKIGDVIAIKYKYAFLKRYLRTIGLTPYENEILHVAIIAADIEEDKRYTVRKLRAFENFSIDGIFNFRLQPLKNKWREVVSFMPFFFTGSQLCDFVSFILGEKRGKKVLIEGDRVYDANFNRLTRSSLISSDFDVVKEALLSHSANVEVVKSVSSREERELKRYFGARVCFLSGSLQKTVDKKN